MLPELSSNQQKMKEKKKKTVQTNKVRVMHEDETMEIQTLCLGAQLIRVDERSNYLF